MAYWSLEEGDVLGEEIGRKFYLKKNERGLVNQNCGNSEQGVTRDLAWELVFFYSKYIHTYISSA